MSLSLDCDDELVNRLTDFFEREKMEQIFQSVYAENAALFAEIVVLLAGFLTLEGIEPVLCAPPRTSDRSYRSAVIERFDVDSSGTIALLELSSLVRTAQAFVRYAALIRPRRWAARVYNVQCVDHEAGHPRRKGAFRVTSR